MNNGIDIPSSPAGAIVNVNISSVTITGNHVISMAKSTGAGAGTIPSAGVYAINVYNVGSVDLELNGVPFIAGATRNYTAQLGKGLPNIAFDDMGTTDLVWEILSN